MGKIPLFRPHAQRIRILNPLAGGTFLTSRRRAERFVRRGLARWISADTICFAHADEARRQLRAEIELRQLQADGYDRVGRALTLREIRAIPVLMPQKLLARNAPKEGPGGRAVAPAHAGAG